ncbi:hypothetical protein WJX84_008274 [Apatococcus fuscideae]|uniref:Uncharacterized protein n=1 Tax=Apatococcus fuscideae TaxID=2026836 RepID=A0AAW1T2B3_9CHLO
MGAAFGKQQRTSDVTSAVGGYGQFDDHEGTWVFHLWLVNDSVDPPAYLHVPAVLDTGSALPNILDTTQTVSIPCLGWQPWTDCLGLHLDRANRAIRTARLRTII